MKHSVSSAVFISAFFVLGVAMAPAVQDSSEADNSQEAPDKAVLEWGRGYDIHRDDGSMSEVSRDEDGHMVHHTNAEGSEAVGTGFSTKEVVEQHTDVHQEVSREPQSAAAAEGGAHDGAADRDVRELPGIEIRH